jgi:hypothetical protein
MVAIALSACGDDSVAPAESTGTTVSPLSELMGWTNASPEESRRQQLQVEDLVAACMREEGWEYIPVDWMAASPDQDEDSALVNDPQAYGEKYGYGVVRNYEQWEEPSLLGEEPADGGAQVDDPNQDYVSSLSEDENEQYYASLYGQQSDVTASTVSASGDDDVAVAGTAAAAPVRMEDQGCTGQAQAEVYGSDPMQDNPDLQERMNEFWQDSESDPRLVEASETWTDCMSDAVAGLEVAGVPITKPDQMYSYFDKLKYQAMGLEIVPFEDGEDSDVAYYTAWTDDDGKGEAAVGEPTPIPEADLEELRTTELDMWKQDNQCQQEADFTGIRAQIEQELVDELRADFPELGSGAS